MGEKQKRKDRKSDEKVRIILSFLLLIVLLMVGLYIMINDSENYIYMGIILVLMLIFSYLFITSVLEQSKKREEKIIEQPKVQEVQKIQKSIFIQP